MHSFSRFVSLVLHPIFLPVYMAFIIVSSHPIKFAQMQGKHYTVTMGLLVGLMTIYPLVSMAIMKGLKLIDSFEIKDRKQRFIPMIAVATFWLLAFLMFQPNSKTAFSVDPLLSNMILGCVCAIFLAFFFNSLQKISFHTIGMGGLVGMLLQIMPEVSANLASFFVAAVLLSGLVGTARLQLKAHTNSEIYGGFLVGFFSQFFAYQFFDRIVAFMSF